MSNWLEWSLNFLKKLNRLTSDETSYKNTNSVPLVGKTMLNGCKYEKHDFVSMTLLPLELENIEIINTAMVQKIIVN